MKRALELSMMATEPSAEGGEEGPWGEPAGGLVEASGVARGVGVVEAPERTLRLLHSAQAEHARRRLVGAVPVQQIVRADQHDHARDRAGAQVRLQQRSGQRVVGCGRRLLRDW